MKVKSLKNISNDKVKVTLSSNGQSVFLPPGSTIESVNVFNEKELKGKVHIVQDLTEVNESQGKTKLYD